MDLVVVVRCLVKAPWVDCLLGVVVLLQLIASALTRMFGWLINEKLVRGGWLLYLRRLLFSARLPVYVLLTLSLCHRLHHECGRC